MSVIYTTTLNAEKAMVAYMRQALRVSQIAPYTSVATS
jgi:hypothetical protein